jgi:hypothetical protein
MTVHPPPEPRQQRRASSPGDPVIAVVRDIACSPSDRNFNNLQGTAGAAG